MEQAANGFSLIDQPVVGRNRSIRLFDHVWNCQLILLFNRLGTRLKNQLHSTAENKAEGQTRYSTW